MRTAPSGFHIASRVSKVSRGPHGFQPLSCLCFVEHILFGPTVKRINYFQNVRILIAGSLARNTKNEAAGSVPLSL